MAAALGAAFAAAMRVIDRVHRRAANGRTLALPHIAAGLADDLVHMVGVRDRADRRHALEAHLARFPRVQAQDSVALVTADELNICPGRARDLAAGAGL